MHRTRGGNVLEYQQIQSEARNSSNIWPWASH